MPYTAWIKEILLNRSGLKNHAKKSKKHLIEWLIGEEKHHARNVNCVLVDYARPRLCQVIVNLNNHH